MISHQAIQHLLVYGTLRVGQGAYRGFHLADTTDHVATVQIPGKMYHFGGFPGIRLDEQGVIIGDLLKMHDPETLMPQMDRYEGVPSLYTREIVDVIVPSEVGEEPAQVKAFVYQYNGNPNNKLVIESGDWLNVA
jgi:gamma-glutamylcyclotransferase (GGCT)/AIG2-like uncharacterized protein YtfP